MEVEIEAKFLDIDIGAVRERLASLGAKRMYPEVLMRRENFDYSDRRLFKVNGWVRLRDEGDKVTLSYKQLHDRTLHGTKEASVVVGNYVGTKKFLEAIGFVPYSYQETKRELWILNDVEVAIDTWPWVPSFLEIEGESEVSVRTVSQKLGLDWSEAGHGSVEIVYQKHYDVTEDEINGWQKIVFSPVPSWLEEKRK